MEEKEEEEGARNLMNRLLEDPGPETARVNGVAGGSVSVGGVSDVERELVASTSSEGPGKERSKSKKIGWAKKCEWFYRLSLVTDLSLSLSLSLSLLQCQSFTENLARKSGNSLSSESQVLH